jgi:hypothetical protein
MSKKAWSRGRVWMLARAQRLVFASYVVAGFCVAYPLGASAQATGTHIVRQKQTKPTTSSQQLSNNSLGTQNPQVQGCGNSGKPGCPPKRCPPGQCRKNNCSPQQSCDTE